MTTPGLPREELTASLAARRELGPDYDAAFIEALAERIEAAAAARRPAEEQKGERAAALAVLCVSLGVSIPTSAIAVSASGLAGLVVVWAAICLINVAYALRRRG